MPHWEEAEDEYGYPIWIGYVDCGPWGLVEFTRRVRWLSLGLSWRKEPLWLIATS